MTETVINRNEVTITPEKLDELERVARQEHADLEFSRSCWYTYDSLHSGDHGVLEEHYEYVAAIHPATILSLIARVRELGNALDNAVYFEPKLLRIANISRAHAALNKE